MDVQILRLAARPMGYVPFSRFDHDLEPIWRWLPYGNRLLRYRMKRLLRSKVLSIDRPSERFGTPTRIFHTTTGGLDYLRIHYPLHQVGTLAQRRH
jgi:hypothetical protein